MTGKLPCPQCTTTNQHKIVVGKENKRELRISNSKSKTIHKIKIDNCVINDDSLKCDYLFEIEEHKQINHAIYLELKGKGVTHGLNQIKSVLTFCKDRHIEVKKDCYIICSAVPRSANTTIQIAKTLLKTKFEANLYIRENSHEIEV